MFIPRGRAVLSFKISRHFQCFAVDVITGAEHHDADECLSRCHESQRRAKSV